MLQLSWVDFQSLMILHESRLHTYNRVYNRVVKNWICTDSALIRIESSAVKQADTSTRRFDEKWALLTVKTEDNEHTFGAQWAHFVLVKESEWWCIDCDAIRGSWSLKHFVPPAAYQPARGYLQSFETQTLVILRLARIISPSNLAPSIQPSAVKFGISYIQFGQTSIFSGTAIFEWLWYSKELLPDQAKVVLHHYRRASSVLSSRHPSSSVARYHF